MIHNSIYRIQYVCTYAYLYVYKYVYEKMLAYYKGEIKCLFTWLCLVSTWNIGVSHSYSYNRCVVLTADILIALEKRIFV